MARGGRHADGRRGRGAGRGPCLPADPRGEGGTEVVCSSRGVRIFPLFQEQESEEFGFMASDVSSERSVDVAISRVAEELARQKRDGGRVVVVAGRWSSTPAAGPRWPPWCAGDTSRGCWRATPWPSTTSRAPCSAPLWESRWTRGSPCSKATATTSAPSTPSLPTAPSRRPWKAGAVEGRHVRMHQGRRALRSGRLAPRRWSRFRRRR